MGTEFRKVKSSGVENDEVHDVNALSATELQSVALVAQSCLTLRNPMDCSPPGSSVHGILQARILEWVAISSSRGSSPPSDRT